MAIREYLTFFCGNRSSDAYHQTGHRGGLGPDDIACASSAYEAALKLLNLTDRTDPLTEVVAKKVIEVAQAGEDDAMRICARVLDELGISPTEAAPSEAAPPEPDKPRDLDRQAILLELQTLKSGEPMNALPRLRELASEIEQADADRSNYRGGPDPSGD